MDTGSGSEQEVGVRRSMRGRVTALAVGVVTATALLVSATPALAQFPEGTTAAVVVGGPTAVCPPGSPGALVPGGGTFGDVTVSGAGRCTPTAADAEGYYTVGGSGPLPFTAECTTAGETRSGVTVPAGTTVNGQVVNVPTVIDYPAFVVFPGPNGRTATLNQVTTTATSVTVTAIAFTGGPVVGQVVCGTAAYPLPVNTGDASGAPAAVVTPPMSSGEGDSGVNLILLGGALAVVVLLAQVAVARRFRRAPAA